MHLKKIKKRIGKEPLCNLRPERAPKIGTFVFPLCWRCTGLLIGGIIATCIKLCTLIDSCPICAISSCAPLALDWSIQKLNIKESTNVRRFVTGIVLGLGQVFW